jgi:hypothetical protein
MRLKETGAALQSVMMMSVFAGTSPLYRERVKTGKKTTSSGTTAPPLMEPTLLSTQVKTIHGP